jgi:hypothetical protein
MHVRRARASTSSPAASGPLNVASKALFVLGALGIGLGALLPILVEREGTLTAHGVFSVRTPAGLDVERLTSEREVKAGEPLAWFRSPPRQAERGALDLRIQATQIERMVTLEGSLPVDSELARQELDLHAERRHLQAIRESLASDRETILRDELRTRRSRTEQLERLEGDLARLAKEREQMHSLLELTQSRLAKAEALFRKDLVSGDSLDERRHEVATQAAEVSKLTSLTVAVGAERAQVQRSLEDLEAVGTEQVRALQNKIDAVAAQAQALELRAGPLQAALAADRRAAELRRQQRASQLALELEQLELQRNALDRTLTEAAPFSGRVVYRNPSPGLGKTGTPQLALASGDAFRLRLRLPTYEARALARESVVTIELLPELPRRRFYGRPGAVTQLRGDASYRIVEVVCDPPIEALKELVEGDTVAAELRWRPPLWAVPASWIGLALLALGGVLGLASRYRAARNAAAHAARKDSELPSNFDIQSDVILLKPSDLVECGALDEKAVSDEPLAAPGLQRWAWPPETMSTAEGLDDRLPRLRPEHSAEPEQRSVADDAW